MNERTIFLEAVEITTPAERAAYLDRACNGDADLRKGVEGLLAANDRSGSFMPGPAGGAITSDHRLSEGPGSRVGPYKLLQQIGEGGMGVVYMAEQEVPVRRKVALKIVKPGMDSKQVVARFEAERQALGMMDHPNIAKVFDAGMTESGRPFFVMELIHGVPITEYCDANKLTPRERLELFVPVCQAIQHAHMKGVIHRDVKPSNVLVTMYDDKPVPKVIDFGVAKAVEQRLTEKTLFTQYGALVGTFEYMSPEQAEMNAFGVDTRSDVYSLGVLLYELLTGSTPLERQRLRTAAFGEVVRLIKEEEPPKPSMRISTSGTLAKVAAARKTEPGKLSDLVRGELDWIVMRCLEKDRTRRYDTAIGLARDVERHLTGDAVEACPPTLGYRLTKAYRKNRAVVLVGGAFAAVLLAATGVSLAFGMLAKRAETDAIAARNAEAEQRERAVDFGKQAADQRDQTQTAFRVVQSERDRVRRLLYASHMASASFALAEGRGEGVLQALAETTPMPGEPDMRGWEWHYLDRMTRPQREYKLDVPDSGSALLDQNACPDGRWTVTRRPVADGIAFDITDTATGRRIGTVPKSGAITTKSGDSLIPLQATLSENGSHLLITEGRPSRANREAKDAPQSTRAKIRPRIWEVETGKEVAAPGELMNQPGQSRIALGANAAWIAWLKVIAPNAPPAFPTGGPTIEKGPVTCALARWEQASGKVTRTELTVGTGWGVLRLGRDGRTVDWLPILESIARGGMAGSNGTTEYGELQRWHVESPDKPRASIRVPALGGGPSLRQGSAPSASWKMRAIEDRQVVTVHSLADGRVLWQFLMPAGQEAGFARRTGFVVSDDGNRLVFHRPGTLTVVDKSASGPPVQRSLFLRDSATRKSEFGTNVSFRLLPDGRTLALLSEDTVRVWDLDQKSERVPTRGVGFPQQVADPDGSSWLVLRSADGRHSVKWPNPQPTGTVPVAQKAPNPSALLIDAAGKQVAKFEITPSTAGTSNQAGWHTRAIKFVDSDRRLLINSYRPKDDKLPGKLVLTPETVDAVFNKKEWTLYDLEKPGLERLAGGLGHLELAPNTPYLFRRDQSTVLSGIEAVSVFEARTGVLVREFRPLTGSRFTMDIVASRFFDQSGSRVVMTTTTGMDVLGPAGLTGDQVAPVRCEVCETATGKRLWAEDLGEAVFRIKSSGGSSAHTPTARFTPDGKRVVIQYMTADGLRLQVRSAATGVEERTLAPDAARGVRTRISSYAFTPDGRHMALAVGAVPRTDVFEVWNLDTGERVQRLTGLADGFGEMTISPDATRFFYTERTPMPGQPGRLHVWDLTTGRELLTLPLDYGPNPQRTFLRDIRFEAGKLFINHPDWVQSLDGTPSPEPKK